MGHEISMQYRNIHSLICSVWSIHLGLSVQDLPQSKPLRVYLFSWIIFSYIFNRVYQIYVTSLFVNPGYELQIRKYDDLQGGGLVYGFHSFHDRYLGDEMLKLLSPRGKCDSPSSCFGFALSGPKRATFTSRAFAPFLAQNITHKYPLTVNNLQKIQCKRIL